MRIFRINMYIILSLLVLSTTAFANIITELKKKIDNRELVIACYEGEYEVVLELIRKGANVNLPGGIDGEYKVNSMAEIDRINNLLNSYSFLASEYDKKKFFDIDPVKQMKEIQDKYPGYSLKGSIHYNIYYKKINQGYSIIIDFDRNGKISLNAPLIIAIGKNHEIVKLLLNNGADPNVKAINGISALALATKLNDYESIEVLIKAGCKLDVFDSDGNSPLITACMECNYNIAIQLINSGADINFKGQDGKTALMSSLESGCLDIAGIIMKKEADINLEDKSGNTALHLAIKHNYTDIVKQLISLGANTKATDWNELDLIYAALLNNNNELLELFLRYEPDINTPSVDGMTPLIAATTLENSEAIKLLLKHGAQIDVKGMGGLSALGYAMMKGNINIVKLLIKSGADLQTTLADSTNLLLFATESEDLELVKYLLENDLYVNSSKSDQVTPLMIASGLGNLGIVKELIRVGANTNSEDINGRNPLIYACVSGNVDIVKILVNSGAKWETEQNDKSTYIKIAAKSNHVELLNYFINSGWDINKTSPDLVTPLMVASYNGNIEVVNILLHSNADINSIDNKDRTSLLYAVSGNYSNIAEQLIIAGAYPNVQDIEGNTPLMISCQKGNVEIFKGLIEANADYSNGEHRKSDYFKIAIANDYNTLISYLISIGWNQELQITEIFDLILLASINGNSDVSNLLIDGLSTIDSKNNDGQTLLMVSSAKGDINLIKYLIDKGASIDAKDNGSYTALMHAIASEQVEAVELLLKRDAFRLADKTSAMNLAIKSENCDIVRLLKNYGADPGRKGNKLCKNMLSPSERSEYLYTTKPIRFDVFKMVIAIGGSKPAMDNYDSRLGASFGFGLSFQIMQGLNLTGEAYYTASGYWFKEADTYWIHFWDVAPSIEYEFSSHFHVMGGMIFRNNFGGGDDGGLVGSPTDPSEVAFEDRFRKSSQAINFGIGYHGKSDVGHAIVELRYTSFIKDMFIDDYGKSGGLSFVLGFRL